MPEGKCILRFVVLSGAKETYCKLTGMTVQWVLSSEAAVKVFFFGTILDKASIYRTSHIKPIDGILELSCLLICGFSLETPFEIISPYIGC